MSKVNLNKKSVKQQGGQMIPQEPGMQNTPQVDPMVQKISEMISMSVQQGRDIIDIVTELSQKQVDQQVIGQALMMGGMQEDEIFSVFEQVQESIQPPGPSNAESVNRNPQLLARNEEMESTPDNFLEGVETDIMGKSGIEIKKKNRGKFTAWAKARGMGVQEAASKVMANKDKYPPSVVKMANFAKNAAKFKREEGGETFPDLTGDGKVTQADILKGRGVFQPGGETIDDYYQDKDGNIDIQQLDEVVISAPKEKSFLQMMTDGAFVNEDDSSITKTLKNQFNPLLQADNLLQLAGIPANVIREGIEGISGIQGVGEEGGLGDGKFNFGDIVPDLYNTTIFDEDKAQTTVSQTLGVDNFAGGMAIDLALDPTTYIGAGIVKNLIQKFGKNVLPKLAKFVGKTSENLGRLIPKEEGGDTSQKGFFKDVDVSTRANINPFIFGQDQTTTGGGFDINSWDQRAAAALPFSGSGLAMDAFLTGTGVLSNMFSSKINSDTGLKAGYLRDLGKKTEQDETRLPSYFDYKLDVDDSEENVNALSAYYKKFLEEQQTIQKNNQLTADQKLDEAQNKLLKQIDLVDVLSQGTDGTQGTDGNVLFQNSNPGAPLAENKYGGVPKAQTGEEILSFKEWVQVDPVRRSGASAPDDYQAYLQESSNPVVQDVETSDDLLDQVNMPELKPDNVVGGFLDFAKDSNAMDFYTGASTDLYNLARVRNNFYKQDNFYDQQQNRADNLMADNLFPVITSDVGDKGNYKVMGDVGQLRSTKDRIATYDEFFEQPIMRFPSGRAAEGGEPDNEGFRELPDYVQDKIMKRQEGGEETPEMIEYLEALEFNKKARQAVGTNDKELLASFTSRIKPDTPYGERELARDFSELQKLRQAADLGLMEEASILFPHVGQQLRGGFNQILGTNFEEGGEKGEAAYLANRDRVIKRELAKAQKAGQIENFFSMDNEYVPEYIQLFKDKYNLKEKDAVQILQAMNLGTGDTLITGANQNEMAAKSIANRQLTRFIAEDKDPFGYYGGNNITVGREDRMPYHTSQPDPEDGLSYDFMEKLFPTNNGNYLDVIKSKLPNKQTGGETVELSQDMITELIAAGADIEIL